MSELYKSGIIVSRGNSTTVALGASASFVGQTEDVTSYEEIDINLAGSPSNAPGSLYFEFSPDGTNWDVSVLIGGSQLSGPSIVPQLLRVVLPYFRVRYINGTTPQSTLRLTVCFHRTSGTRLTRFLNQSIDNTEPVEVGKSVILAQRPSDSSYQLLAMNATNALYVDGSEVVQPVKATSTLGTTSSVTGSTSTITLLAANPNRLGSTVYNDSTTNMYIKLGSGATTTNFTVKMGQGAYYETPFGYTGILTGTFDVANGNARITEIT